MPGFKDFVNLATLLETDMDDLLMKQTLMKMASAAARTAALTGFFREGLMTYLDDLNTLGVNTGATDVWSTIGPVHGALTVWTPAIVQSGSVTSTNLLSWYMRVGRTIIGAFNVSITGTGTVSNLITVSLPVTATSGGNDYVGSGYMNDSSGPNIYPCYFLLNSTTTVRAHTTQGSSAGTFTETTSRLGSAQFTGPLANTDLISGTFTYQAAADA